MINSIEGHETFKAHRWLYSLHISLPQVIHDSDQCCFCPITRYESSLSQVKMIHVFQSTLYSICSPIALFINFSKKWRGGRDGGRYCSYLLVQTRLLEEWADKCLFMRNWNVLFRQINIDFNQDPTSDSSRWSRIQCTNGRTKVIGNPNF